MQEAQPTSESYIAFLHRLKTYERLEPLAKSRGPEKLAGVKKLLAALQHPEQACKIVHVAGTNGKGLSSAMIAALLQKEGHAVGLYTSPHLVDIRERIALNGEPVSPELFALAGHRVLDLADQWREALHFSYFDLLTAMALLVFREARCAWAVLETGLGGRVDATNTAPKELAVITRIGLDHLHVLGNTLEAIAEEKLGICVAGAPTVLARQSPPLTPWLLQRLREMDTPVTHAPHLSARAGEQRDAGADPVGDTSGFTIQAPDGQALHLPLPRDEMPAGPQLACAANALAAADVLLGPATGSLWQSRLQTALGVRLAGRLDKRARQKVIGEHGNTEGLLHTVVLDGGHNPEAMAALAEQLSQWGMGEVTLLLALQKDKLIPPLLEPLGALAKVAKRLLALEPQTIRAPTPEDLRGFLRELPNSDDNNMPAHGGSALPQPEFFPSVPEALNAALETPLRPLVVAGSFWTVGDVLQRLLPEKPEEGA